MTRTISRVFLGLSILAIGITACNKNDKASDADVVGTWSYATIDYRGNLDGNLEQYSDTSDGSDKMKFDASGVFTDISYGDTTVGKWLKTGSKLKLIQTLGSAEVSQEMDIKTLNKDALTLYYKFVNPQDNSKYMETTIKLKR